MQSPLKKRAGGSARLAWQHFGATKWSPFQPVKRALWLDHHPSFIARQRASCSSSSPLLGLQHRGLSTTFGRSSSRFTSSPVVAPSLLKCPFVALQRSTTSHGALSSRREVQRLTAGPSSVRGYLAVPQRNTLGGAFVIYSLLAINAGVFYMWREMPEYWMMENFTTSWENLYKDRPFTLLTAAVSHRDLSHIAFNSMGLYFLGAPLISLIGPVRFLAIYAAAGICGSLGHLYYTRYFKYRNRSYWYHEHALGMSGAVTAFCTMFAILLPHETLLIFGVIPTPAWLAGLGFIALDAYNAYHNPNSRISHSGHLGGALVGALYGLWYLRRNAGVSMFRHFFRSRR
ncbi:Rhomboid family intramembrane serine protease [Balamuthia mandrillaris]